jgi:glutamate-1-semialdehyde 2,1-aminomutase
LSNLHHSAHWNDQLALENLFNDMGDRISALVVAADYVHMAAGQSFYPFLRNLTQKYGTVLIFDEIVTGFRIATGGVQEFFGVIPDLSVFAKGIANGLPLSVYCGKADIMDKLDQAVVSSTYGGEVLSLAAAKATIETYQTHSVILHIWQKAERVWSGLNGLFKQYNIPGRLQGLWPCISILFEKHAPTDLEEHFFRAAYNHGVSLYNIPYVSFSHQNGDIDETLERMESALKTLQII